MINLLLPDHVQELRAVADAVAAPHDFETASRLLVTRLAAVLDAPTALIEERGASWRVIAQAGEIPSVEHVSGALGMAYATDGHQSRKVTALTVPERGSWT